MVAKLLVLLACLRGPSAIRKVIEEKISDTVFGRKYYIIKKNDLRPALKPRTLNPNIASGSAFWLNRLNHKIEIAIAKKRLRIQHCKRERLNGTTSYFFTNYR